MELLELIKKRRTIRKYKDKPIPKRIIDKIIEAGRWGPSVVSFQPWKFIVVTKKDVIRKIHQIISMRVKKMGVVGTILGSTSKAVDKASCLIMIYNKGAFVNFASKFGKDCVKFAKVAEISAISAAIQNMILVSESLGIGSCWHDTPLFCEKKINKLLKIEDRLVAVLTFGYPAEKGKRAKREALSDMVRYMK